MANTSASDNQILDFKKTHVNHNIFSCFSFLKLMFD